MCWFRPAQSNSSRGDWRIWDHGDPEVDEHWRKLFECASAVNRHASLGGAIPPEDASYVPPEFVNHGVLSDSYYICMRILDVS